tara:strand:+ start:1994 stop:2974 length:981 start_codon:yes stop_codon:yes gene_type:complete
MKNLSLFILLVLFSSFYCKAQNDFNLTTSNLQYGVALKLNLEFGIRFKKKFKFNKRNFFSPGAKLSLTAAVGYEKTDLGFFPAIHTGVILFNKNTIGSNQEIASYVPQVHFFANAVVAAEIDRRQFNRFEKSVPFYHFTEFVANPLQNPYFSSISFGVNFIKVKEDHQWVGFFNANAARTVQISYYNDGGPVLGWPGDNMDRYYTGGGHASYHGNYRDEIDLIELSYHKYTGYQKYAFDVADKLQIDFLNYNDSNQFSYNQQRWRLNFSSLRSGYGGSISIFNLNRIDFQDFLHFNTNVPYHPDYYNGFKIMFGGRYEYNLITIPK